MSARTLVIAECGASHDGDFVKAQRLVDAARDVGADVAKFQFWSSADRLADRRRVPEHYREIYRRYQMPESWLRFLKARCDAYGIEFMATCYLPEDVAVVAPFVKRFKVASFEAGDEAFIAAHQPFQGNHEREIVVSHGMGSTWMDRRWFAPVRHLHCVSAYPARIESLNLGVLREGWCEDMVDRWPDRSVWDGFSDHSAPEFTWTGALAVAAGAEIIEAHLRLDDTDPANPDAPHAMTPRQFTEYVANIRFAEACLGDGMKRLQSCEAECLKYRVVS